MVSEFLRRSLGEHSLFPEVKSQVAAGLGDNKVAQGGSAVPGWCIAVISTGQQQQLLGYKNRDDVNASGGQEGMIVTSTESQQPVTFHGTVWGLPVLFPK